MKRDLKATSSGLKTEELQGLTYEGQIGDRVTEDDYVTENLMEVRIDVNDKNAFKV